MKQIHNEDKYYSLPGYDPNLHQQHKPINMIYKTMLYLPHSFKAYEAKEKILELWCVNLHTAQIGRKLRELTEAGMVTRRHMEPGFNRYTYTKTHRFYEATRDVEDINVVKG